MTRIARLALLALVAVVPLGLLAACGDDDDGGDGGLKKVTFMLDWTPNTNHAGVFIAKEKGYYRDAGLDVEIIEPATGGVEQAVGTGKAHFGISIQENVIPARAEEIPLVSIAAVVQHNTSSLVSLKKDNITRPRDLAGKTYGGFGGALEEALVKKLVSCDGGDPASVKFVGVGNVDYLVGMEQDQYDFAWIFDGWDGLRYSQVEKKEVNTLPFTKYTSCIPDWYTPVIITSAKMASDNEDIVRKFMEATVKGYNEAIANPQSSVDAILKNAPETDKQLLDLSAKYLASRYVDQGRPWGLQDEATWAGFETWLRENKVTEKKVDVSKAYTNKFLPGQK